MYNKVHQLSIVPDEKGWIVDKCHLESKVYNSPNLFIAQSRRGAVLNSLAPAVNIQIANGEGAGWSCAMRFVEWFSRPAKPFLIDILLMTYADRDPL